MNSYIIYKATNKHTNEVYIGATTNSMESRKNDHLAKATSGSGHYFQNAIATFGAEAFQWEQIDIATSVDELASKEILYIKQYDSKKSGYNSDKGGGIKKTIYKYNLDGTLSDSFPCLTSAANSIGATKKRISQACWNVNNTLGGYFWNYEYKNQFVPAVDLRKKKVNQYTLKGDLLATYVSASEACRKTSIKKNCITRCCRGERKSSGGFVWKYS